MIIGLVLIRVKYCFEGMVNVISLKYYDVIGREVVQELLCHALGSMGPDSSMFLYKNRMFRAISATC